MLDAASKTLLKNAMDNLGLSARAYDRILKVASTLADLEAVVEVQSQHIAKAIQYPAWIVRVGWDKIAILRPSNTSLWHESE